MGRRGADAKLNRDDAPNLANRGEGPQSGVARRPAGPLAQQVWNGRWYAFSLAKAPARF